MRWIKTEERTKRGCKYCTESVTKGMNIFCPHEKCMFLELNEIENFEVETMHDGKYAVASSDEIEKSLRVDRSL